MNRRATITVKRSREDVERLWRSADRPGSTDAVDAAVTFVDAPGDRGTEIHLDLGSAGPGAKLGETLKKLRGNEPRAKAMDDLRRFKQHVETGVIARSEGTPEGEAAERKPKQRPAQPLDDTEAERVGA